VAGVFVYLIYIKIINEFSTLTPHGIKTLTATGGKIGPGSTRLSIVYITHYGTYFLAQNVDRTSDTCFYGSLFSRETIWRECDPGVVFALDATGYPYQLHRISFLYGTFAIFETLWYGLMSRYTLNYRYVTPFYNSITIFHSFKHYTRRCTNIMFVKKWLYMIYAMQL